MRNMPELKIDDKIFQIRGMHIMFDYHLAELYGVETKRLNEQVKRNIERFPAKFMFQLTKKEWELLQTQIENSKLPNILRSQNATLINKRGVHSKYLPYVFTEQGVAMLSAVLRSQTAIKVSIQIMQGFINLRHLVYHNALMLNRMDSFETKLIETDYRINQVFKTIEEKSIIPKYGIFFNGQIFDAYTLIADIIRSADKSIIIIDNYLDDTVLKQLSKRSKNVNVKLYTKNINQVLKQDVEKHNLQYPEIVLNKLITYHDRFIIIDNKIVYHIGASLKDAGKKCFAFSKLDIDVNVILDKL